MSDCLQGARRPPDKPESGAARAAHLTSELGGPDTVNWNELRCSGADNVVSDTDARDTFQLPLVPLADQLRRSA